MDSIIPKALDDYCDAHTSPPSALLAELEAWTRANRNDAQMLTGHVEGALLAWLVRLTKARRVLEIGTFTGYSALGHGRGAAARRRDPHLQQQRRAPASRARSSIAARMEGK